MASSLDQSEEWLSSVVDNYEISSAGRVRRSAPGRCTYVGRVKKLTAGQNGYLVAGVTIHGSPGKKYVHEMVACAFIGPRPDGAVINHIDGDKHNNHVSNLDYVTHAENMRHASGIGLLARGESHGSSRFTESDVREIRERHRSGDSICAIARELAASTCTVFKIIHRVTWKHVQ